MTDENVWRADEVLVYQLGDSRLARGLTGLPGLALSYHGAMIRTNHVPCFHPLDIEGTLVSGIDQYGAKERSGRGILA